MRTANLIGLALALSGAASGQPVLPGTNDSATDPDPIYHVELIVFAYNAADPGEEDFRHALGPLLPGPGPQLLPLPAIELESVFAPGPVVEPDPTTTGEVAAPPLSAGGPADPVRLDRLELFPTSDRSRADWADARRHLPAGFRPLHRSELELADSRATLNRLGAYTVLGHVGWAQAGVDTDRSVQLDLSHLGITNPAGTVEVYLRRFLHVAFDLEYFDGSGTFWKAADTGGIAPLAFAQSYRLTTERNAMRSDELHYVDHPLFGILIRITRAPVSEDADGAAGGNGPAA